MDVKEKISAWLLAKAEMSIAQETERTLRAEILDMCFGANNVGSKNCVKGDYVVKGVYGLTYSLDQEGIRNTLTLGEELPDCIRTKYELDKKAYDGLSGEDALIMDDYLTVKPALPTLEIKPLGDGK